MRVRGFEVVRRFEGFEEKVTITLPKRSTKSSAGYDFYAYEDTIVPSIWVELLSLARHKITGDYRLEMREVKPTYVRTGVKAYMKDDEYLALFNRSSNPAKGLIMATGASVVDADYYNNETNDGEIAFIFYNIFPVSIKIRKGDKIGQGIFKVFLKADNDESSGVRDGGIGSTGR